MPWGTKLATAAALLLPLASAAAQQNQERKPDLADTAQGVFYGDVISDARGASQSDVLITVVKSGPNTVRVTSDYARIPARTFPLTRAMDTIQNARGTEVFLLDLAKSPHRLDLTIDDASWSGQREAAE